MDNEINKLNWEQCLPNAASDTLVMIAALQYATTTNVMIIVVVFLILTFRCRFSLFSFVVRFGSHSGAMIKAAIRIVVVEAVAHIRVGTRPLWLFASITVVPTAQVAR